MRRAWPNGYGARLARRRSRVRLSTGGGGTSLGEWEHNKNEIHINPSGGYYAQVAVSPGDHSLRQIKLQQDAYYPHPVSSELENSGIRVAVGDCSVTERRRWRPPYQTGKTVHVHAKYYKDGRTAPGVCGNGSAPLNHSGNVVTRIGIHTQVRFITLAERLA